jgi:hypothetical protein
MTALEGRIVRLELMLDAARNAIAALQARATSLEGQARGASGMSYNLGGGGSAAASYWAMAPAGGSPASTGTFPTITPSGGTSITVYQSIGGTLGAIGTRTVRWWYRDSLPQYTLVPVVLCADGSFDAICNSCTIVNP